MEAFTLYKRYYDKKQCQFLYCHFESKKIVFAYNKKKIKKTLLKVLGNPYLIIYSIMR